MALVPVMKQNFDVYANTSEPRTILKKRLTLLPEQESIHSFADSDTTATTASDDTEESSELQDECPQSPPGRVLRRKAASESVLTESESKSHV